MDYDKDIYSELAMMIMEHDINFICERYHIPGYELDDLKQEARLALWKALDKFKADEGVLLRTWANKVIKTRMNELLRNSNLLCRKANNNVAYILYRQIITEDIYEKNQEESGGDL